MDLGTGEDLGHRDGFKDQEWILGTGTGMGLGNRSRCRGGCRVWGTGEG